MDIIQVSDAAKAQFIKLCQDNNQKYIVLSCTTRGCSGHTYELNFADSSDSYSDRVKLDAEHSLLLDPKSMMFLLGTTVDWQEEIFGSHFVYNNPAMTGMCGCGESFNFDIK